MHDRTVPQTASARSSTTLEGEDDPHASAAVPKARKLPAPEATRDFRSPHDNPDWEAEEAEREFAAYGGDVPLQEARLGQPYGTRPRRLTGPRRNLGRSSTRGSLPDLYLVDSAFSEAHQESLRVYSRTSQRGGDDAQQGESNREGGKEQDRDPNKVDWDQNDPENPQNWTIRKKWAITLLCALLTVNVTFASSAPSTATRAIAAQFGTSNIVATLATSLFLLGYCLGPLLWAPISELVGRRPVFVITMGLACLFQLPSALAPNITSLLVGRFLAGTFSAAPLTNAGGCIADMWDAIGRGPAMSVFTAAVFLGPVMGPIIGGFLTQSYLGWRWIFWVMMIFSGSCWILVTVLLPETYAPILLAKRAKAMRKAEPEKNRDKYADLERADFSFKSIVTRTLMRPFIMLVVEPILTLTTIYLSVVYGLLYALFAVFPIVFEQKRGFNAGESGLMFIGVGIGTTLGALINVLVQRHYRYLVPKWHGHPPPEERLHGSMYAGPFLLIGIFMLGWTGNYPSVHWIVPEIAGIFLGAGFTLIFISFLSFLIECYLMYSASALAANTIVRSAFGAAFPLFTVQMFNRLGVNWACTLIGGIMILIFPSPYVFYKYGARIRDGSRFAPCLDLHMRERVEREEREARDKTQGASGV